MAATRILACSRVKPCNLTAIFRVHESMVNSVLVIQTRSKVSKKSPFLAGKGHKEKIRDENSSRKTYIGKMTVNRPLNRPLLIDSPGVIFSDYLPIRRYYFFTPWGIKERWNAFKNGFWTIYSLVLIRRHIKPFKLTDFGPKAQEIYIAANEALARKSKKDLQEVVTNSVYRALSNEFFPPNKNLHWRFISAVTRPQVVHVRVSPVQTKENLFAQITVKINSKQVMAVKDKYGRHITGSDKQVKQVIDYVVFERPLTSTNYGTWRVCGKLHALPAKEDTGKQLAKNVPAV
ncbi:probable 39S ribosomal protein L45, mitochondrial [Stylophora pistillata]|uniref:probable 39S ribosomal protein L45, mitochondrial n=1 Tax=Stylophora pistillata TaxID=50429 RepID=UPI000C03F937|nr:probable 39S ribosomal protein L45, mitochondrial [Stylophora pistillata]